MPTVRTVTVKSSGGDYTSLNAAEAGEQGDLPSLDRQLDIECYAIDDTTACTFSGWTTDATRYIRVFCPAGEGHEGVWSTSKYRRRSSSGFGTGLTISEEFVRVEGLQCYQPSGSYTAIVRVTGVSTTPANSDIRIDRCIVNATGSTVSLAASYFDCGTINIRNSLVYGGSQDGIDGGSGGSNTLVVNIDNCTVVANGVYGITYVGTQAFTLRNVYSGGNGTDAYGATMTRTTCAHDTASVFTGSTASIAYDTSNFVNVTGGSEDLHLASGADATLKTGGTDLSGTFTTDIDGETRSDWSIGADEIVSAPGGLSIPIAAYHYNHHLKA